MVPGINILTIIEPANTSQPHPPSGGTKSYSMVSSFALGVKRAAATINICVYLFIDLSLL